MSRVAAIILNYRRAEATLDCLAALSSTKGVDLDLLVVDNASGDGSEEAIRKARPDVGLIQTGSNLGYAGGMNAGLRRVVDEGLHDFVLLINSDTLVDPDAVRTLVGSLDGDPSAGAAAGTIYYHPARDRVWYAGGMITYRRAHAITHRVVPEDRRAAHVSFVTGCALMLRVAAVRTAGMFNEEYFMYLEDVDLSRRLLASGFTLLYVPGARFFHRMEEDEQTPLKVYFVTRNRLKMLEGASARMDRVLGRLFVLGVLAMRLPRWTVTDPAKARAALAGVRDYFAGRAGGGSFMMQGSAQREGGTHAHRH